MSIPERAPNGVKTKERSEQERQSTFWRRVDRILKTRDPEELKYRLRDRLRPFHQMDQIHVDDALNFMETAHAGQKRKLTGESYELHPLQVTLIYIEMMYRFSRPIRTEDIEILLNHDVLEDTTTEHENLTTKFVPFTVSGINGLSHSGHKGSNGNKLGHSEYIERLFEENSRKPRLRLLSKKVADFIANGNDPKSISSLFVEPEQSPEPKKDSEWIADPLSFPIFEWEGNGMEGKVGIVSKKIREMSIFRTGLAPVEGEQEETVQEKAMLAQLLEEAIEYTKQSKERGFTVDRFLESLPSTKTQANVVYLTDAERRFLSTPYQVPQK